MHSGFTFRCFVRFALSLLTVHALQAVTPKEATLVTEVEAPIVSDGKRIGSVKLPPGSTVEVMSVETDGVMVSRGGLTPFKISKNTLPPEATASENSAPTPSQTPATSNPAVVSPPSFSESLSESPSLKAAVEDWQAKNNDPSLSIKALPKGLTNYLKSLPPGVTFEIYRRPIPDQRKEYMQDGSNIVRMKEVPSWHQAAPESAKAGQIIDRLRAMSKGIGFPGGHRVDPGNSPLNTILVGGPDCDRKASEMILKSMKAEDFNAEGWILYLHYRNRLTPEAVAKLEAVLKESATSPDILFSPKKAASGDSISHHHNQFIWGTCTGLLYGKYFGDPKLYGSMNDQLTRGILAAGVSGYFCTEYTSPNYDPRLWANYMLLYGLIKDPQVEAKLRLIMDMMGLDFATRFHAPSSFLPAPYSRNYAYNFLYYGAPLSIPGIMNRVSDGYCFYNIRETSGYVNQYGVLTEVRPFFPDYMQEIAFRKPFPYRLWNPVLREETSVKNGKFDHYKFEDTVAYETEEYALGSRPDAYWAWDHGNENIPYNGVLSASWRRSERPVQSRADGAVLFTAYRYNTADGLGDFRDQGMTLSAQFGNKAIVLSYPGEVSDERLLKDSGIAPGTLREMGNCTCIGFPDEIRGIWADDEFIAGQWRLTENGTDEVRLRITGKEFPYAMKGNKTVFLEDFNTFVAMKPFPASDLGRGIDGKLALNTFYGWPVLAVLFHNYAGEAKAFSTEDRTRQRSGYALELGDRKSYADLAAFRNHIRGASVESSEKDALWIARYTSGKDSLECEYDTKRFSMERLVYNGKEQNEILFPNNPASFSYRSGVASYGWMELEPYSRLQEVMRSDSMVKSMAKEIKVGNATLRNPSGAMVYLVAEPNKGIYVLGNLTTKTCDFTLETPFGTVEVKNLNLGRIVYRSRDAQPLQIDPVPGLITEKTTALLKH